MKKFVFLFAALVSALTFTACSSDDDNTPTPTPNPEPEVSTATIEMKAYVGEELLKYADAKLVYYINEEDSVVKPITSALDTIQVKRENLPFTNADLKLDAYIRTTAKNPLPAYEDNKFYNLKRKLDVKIYLVTGSSKLTYEDSASAAWNLNDFEVPGNEISTYFPVSKLEYHFQKDKDGSHRAHSEAI